MSREEKKDVSDMPRKPTHGSDKSKSQKHTGHWSGDVTRHSNALTLDPGLFTFRDPRRIAASLKHSAVRSRRRKGSPLQSAMSMLNFYINRAGATLSPSRKRLLERAKVELRKLFVKHEGKPRTAIGSGQRKINKTLAAK